LVTNLLTAIIRKSTGYLVWASRVHALELWDIAENNRVEGAARETWCRPAACVMEGKDETQLTEIQISHFRQLTRKWKSDSVITDPLVSHPVLSSKDFY